MGTTSCKKKLRDALWHKHNRDNRIAYFKRWRNKRRIQIGVRVCPACDSQFQPRKKSQKYCSLACRLKCRPSRYKPKPRLPCASCGKPCFAKVGCIPCKNEEREAARLAQRRQILCIQCGKQKADEFLHAKVCSEACRKRRKVLVDRANSRAKKARRRALLACAPVGDMERIRQVERDVHSLKRVTCYWCGKKVSGKKCQLDHVIPLSKGGAHDPDNLAPSCKQCNATKKDREPEAFNEVIPQPRLFI